MTLGAAIAEVYRNLGEPRSDLPTMTLGIVDLTLQGAQDIRDFVNQACDAIASWESPNGRKLKLRGLEDSVSGELLSASGTLASQASPYKTIVLPAGFGTTAERYAGWIADFGSGIIRRVLRNPVVAGVSSVVLSRALDSDPVGLTLTLYQRTIHLGTASDDFQYAGRAIEVASLVDLEAQAEVPRAEASDLSIWTSEAVGIPGAYQKRSALTLVLDSAPDDGRSFEVALYRYPTARTLAAEDLDIPDAFHPLAVLYATYLGFLRLNETQSAYAFRRNFEDTVVRIQTQYDFEDRAGGDYLFPGRRS